MTKEELFKIQDKFIQLLQWFVKEGYREEDYFFKNRLKDIANGKLLFYPSVNITRGSDFIEMGAPNEEDLTVYDFSVDFTINVEGDESVMKKWHFFIGQLNKDYDKKFKKPSVFDNCYFSTYSCDNEIKISNSKTDYHGWSMFKADYENKPDYYNDESALGSVQMYIPVKITYTFKSITIK